MRPAVFLAGDLAYNLNRPIPIVVVGNGRHLASGGNMGYESVAIKKAEVWELLDGVVVY